MPVKPHDIVLESGSSAQLQARPKALNLSARRAERKMWRKDLIKALVTEDNIIAYGIMQTSY